MPWAGKYFHVAVEAGRTASQMFAHFNVACLDGVFGHALQIGIRWAANALRVGERFAEVGLGQVNEFGFAEVLKLTSLFSWHRFALPVSTPHFDRLVLGMAIISFLWRVSL